MQGVDRLNFKVSDLELIADAVGPADAARVLFLHGSGQSRQSWRRALQETGRRGLRGIALDMRGHGDSAWSPDGKYDLKIFAADLRQVVDQIGGEVVLVGASLGGLASMLIVAEKIASVRALVLVDITHRVEEGGAKEVVAFMGSAPDGFASLDDAADAVSAYLPHRERPKDTKGLERNLRLRNGRYYWHWDPAFLNMGRGADSDFRNARASVLEQAARSISIPTLLIRGGRSEIVSKESVSEFLEMVPHAEFIDIADAHHMVAGDANDAFNDGVLSFIDRQISSGVIASRAADKAQEAHAHG
ncbi:alpha/beta fold hydrolase [Stenotrophobium rhamnosiphilum]|uniref:Alpha/beta hydrolase n=1 Tax=Stenotrophobium rhamnosiphilum TaxID=2029166 RepID=A0A2T5MCY7_9GAMM|nr:alpha/beta hydrolase [Stenotrophobium rhamnosiphilum]PTU30438.1 alpha/beta hydrolase [Stenotrophobium rhamnosiphilum]